MHDDDAGAPAAQSELRAIVERQRAELAALREDIERQRNELAALRAEACGLSVASLYQSIAIVCAHGETGALEPEAVAERADRLISANTIRGDAGLTLGEILGQFAGMLRALPAMAAGTWRPPKPPAKLRIVTEAD